MNFISIFYLFPFCFRARIEIEIFIQRSAIKVLSLIISFTENTFSGYIINNPFIDRVN